MSIHLVGAFIVLTAGAALIGSGWFSDRMTKRSTEVYTLWIVPCAVGYVVGAFVVLCGLYGLGWTFLNGAY